MTRALALELAPEVRVNAIAPGAILWPEHGGKDDAAKAGDARRARRWRAPARRRKSPKPCAGCCATRRYMTGQVLRLDGGRLLEG